MHTAQQDGTVHGAGKRAARWLLGGTELITNGDLVDDPGNLNLDECARRVGLRPGRLRRAVRDGAFPDPAVTTGGEPRWREADVLRWAAASSRDLAAGIRLTYWPDATTPAEFLGSSTNENTVGLIWQTDRGTITVLWPIASALTPVRVRTGPHVSGTTVVVTVGPGFGIDGPRITATNASGSEKRYEMGWRDLVRVLGLAPPYWPPSLRIPELMCPWSPGAEPVAALPIPDIDTVPLLQLAALYDRDHPTHRTLLNLVQVVQRRAISYTGHDLEILREALAIRPDDVVSTTVAAIPLQVPDTGREELDAAVRRAGWLDVLGRTDSLAKQCVREVLAWDSGEDFPFSNPDEVDPTTPTGKEWLQRLQPILRTAAFELVDFDGAGDTFTDPATDAPVVHKTDGRLVAAIPQRLPAMSPLAELILGDDLIWVRTTGGTLYPAPKSAGFGLSWGYSGSGPGTLALLIDRLLDDINCAAADDINGAPAGLEQLTQTEWPSGTVLTRDQLEAARDGNPPRSTRLR